MKLLLGALALAVATPGGAGMAEEPPLPPARPPELSPAAPPTPAPPPTQMGAEAANPTCLSRLIASGARAVAAAAPASTAEGCGIGSPVRLSSVTLPNGDVVSFPDQPVLECAFAAVLVDYVSLIVAPLGEAMFHAKVASISTGPGYQCRSRDRVPGAKLSAHGKGLAVDFVAIEFTDKRRVRVERQAGADEAAYFRAIRLAACGWFTTVLGPGSDVFHVGNMHLDIEKHGPSANYRICE